MEFEWGLIDIVMGTHRNCLRFATPAEANRRPEARRDTMRTTQGRTSDAEGCSDERQSANMDKQGWASRGRFFELPTPLELMTTRYVFTTSEQWLHSGLARFKIIVPNPCRRAQFAHDLLQTHASTALLRLGDPGDHWLIQEMTGNDRQGGK